ncbi:MAG TPA: hypothetical protein VL625_09680 [Patescibacteria group bacterium]|jgi:hypothetical protein|nr:hypothetical protein [Patescibacteria group bacterium]
MPAVTVDEAIEEIYKSLHEDNKDIDGHIANLKTALTAAGRKEAVFNTSRLAQNNRQGRKTMESYFRQRGVAVVFEDI